MFEKAYAASWVSKPRSMGDVYGKKALDMASAIVEKYAKTDEQKLFVSIAFSDTAESRYWRQMTKKDLDMIRYILRRINDAMQDAQKNVCPLREHSKEARSVAH